MSTKDAEAFRAQVAKSPALQKEVTEAVRKDPNGGVIALGRVHGFEFTGEDVFTVLSGSELSDFELEMVGGGTLTNLQGGDCGGQVRPGAPQTLPSNQELNTKLGGGGFTGGI
jgi:predicted ribosomally synthesized peptide with nif11-like leader